MKVLVNTQVSQENHMKKRILKTLLIGTTVLLFQFALSKGAYADQAEERQRDPVSLRTLDQLKHIRGDDAVKVKVSKKLGKKMEGDQSLKVIVSNAGNPVIKLNFRVGSEFQGLIPQEVVLGPNGLAGAKPIKPRDMGSFRDAMRTVLVDFSTGNLDYAGTSSAATSNQIAADRLADKFRDDRRLRRDVQVKFQKDLRDRPFERAAVDELIRAGVERSSLSAIVVLEGLTDNPVMTINFYDAGMFSKTVELALGLEYQKSMGNYFEEVSMGAFNQLLAVRKLNLKATSPYLEEQKQAYAIYRFGID